MVELVDHEGGGIIWACGCLKQNRMGFPCRHIACVLSEPDANGVKIDLGMTGFPLASIRVFWWSHYYKYGMSNNPAYQELKEALI